MAEIGFTLSSEEHDGRTLVDVARLAEDAGFDFAVISDHFHPWTDRQGHSPFVWSVLGAVASATERIGVGTGVTCPLIRMHPVIVAQAAATVAQLMPGRFFLGLGTGENLNEHVVGAGWPAVDRRLDMLSEAIDVIRELWTGEDVTHRGEHYTVEQARIYTLPDELPPIHVAAKGEKAATLAAEKGDGLVGVGPDAEMLQTFDRAGGQGKPRYGQVHICWAEREDEAVETAHAWWPNAGLEGELSVELPLPRHFEQAAETVRPEDVAKAVTCGPDPEKHLDAIRAHVDAGFDHVYLHQIGPNQEGAIRFLESEVLPKLN
jgi:coenzyme F420-dependent glucose-6-phosphate dehydrogenase